MSDVYKTDTIENHGKTYRIEWVTDYDAGAPWENSDCHGIVTDWTSRPKKPGERILNRSRGEYRYYDYQQTMTDAVRVWGCKPGPDAVESVERDFEYLRAWCNDEWHYCGIIVTLLDEDGEETDISASLWGIESDCDGYHATVIRDLIGDCEYEETRGIYAGATVGIA